MMKMYIKMQNLMAREDGQDLVEYALVVALLALGATASMSSLATHIGNAYGSISSALDAAV